MHLADRPGGEAKAVLEEHGLQSVSAHVPYEALSEDFTATVAFHQAAGNDCLVFAGAGAGAARV